MESALHIPADIFEEMAGMKEIVPPKNDNKEENVKTERLVTPINEKRLKTASLAMISKVQKNLCKSFYKVAKKLLSYQQKDSPIKTKGQKIEVLIRITESVSKTAAKIFSRSFKLFKGLLGIAWKALKVAIRTLFNLIKWLAKLTVKIIGKLLKTFATIARAAGRVFARAFKHLGRMILRMSAHIFRMMKLILKAIWLIIKKLFFRGKPMLKMFKGEPADKPMKQPTLSKKKNKMKLKLKAIGKKSLFIMKVVKKAFKAFGKIVWKIIKKIFSKVILKIVKTITKMIVKFIASQVIGSLIPGLGNLIMGALSMTLMALDVIAIVQFVKGVSKETAFLADEIEEEEDDEEDDDDEEGESGPDINEMGINEVNDFMKNLAANGKENSPEYLEAKTRYLSILMESYESSGDEEISQMIEIAMKTGQIPATLDKTIDALPEKEGIKKLDLKKLQIAIAKREKELIKIKLEAKSKNVFYDKEINSLLTGEVDGGPVWISIGQNILWYVKVNLPLRFPGIDLFKKICQEVTAPYPKDTLLDYKFESEWTYESKAQRKSRVKSGSNKILNDENKDYHYSSVEEFGPQDKFDTVIDRVHRYKFSIKDDVQRVTDTKVGENILQKYKYFRWEEILEILANKEDKIWTIDELLNSEDISIGARFMLLAAKDGLPI